MADAGLYTYSRWHRMPNTDCRPSSLVAVGLRIMVKICTGPQLKLLGYSYKNQQKMHMCERNMPNVYSTGYLMMLLYRYWSFIAFRDTGIARIYL